MFIISTTIGLSIMTKVDIADIKAEAIRIQAITVSEVGLLFT